MESQTFVKKSWGWERWFANTARYCGKHIFVEKDKWSSNGRFHYHKLKDESFYVIEGTLQLEYEIKHGVVETVLLERGQSLRIMQHVKHRFKGVTDGGCHFIEASTTHRDTDSYRVDYNEETKQWKER